MRTFILEPQNSSDQISILQLTDTHLFADEHATLLGIRTTDSFRAVLTTIANQGIPFDGVIVTGDISQDYSAASYQRFAHMIRHLHSRVFFMPGNHDDGPLMYRMFGDLGVNTERSMICGNWHFVFLNSEVYGVPHGWIQRSELNILKAAVEEYPDLHTVVCVHHLPLLVKSRWLDTQTMHNQEEFNQFVAACPNIRLVLCGHVHQEIDVMAGNIRYISTPSTSIQFEPLSHDFALDMRGPGWRYLTFSADGSISTEVYRLPKGRFLPESGVNGY